jgi:hypothetical protein
MRVFVTVEFDTEKQEVVNAVVEILKLHVPLMADNVRYRTSHPDENGLRVVPSQE